MIAVMTDSACPEKIRLEKDGAQMMFTRQQAIQAICFLTNAVYSPGKPISKPIQLYRINGGKS